MANDFVGTWNTIWTNPGGTSQLTIKADGSGTYSNGQVQGKFDALAYSYSGTWAHLPTRTNGTFSFVLVGPANFLGVWVDGNGKTGGQWNGTIDTPGSLARNNKKPK